MSIQRRSAALFVVSILVIIVIPIGYMGAYFAMLESEFSDPDPPKYHFGGERAESLFQLAHSIDRDYLRPGEWLYYGPQLQFDDFD